MTLSRYFFIGFNKSAHKWDRFYSRLENPDDPTYSEVMESSRAVNEETKKRHIEDWNKYRGMGKKPVSEGVVGAGIMGGLGAIAGSIPGAMLSKKVRPMVIGSLIGGGLGAAGGYRMGRNNSYAGMSRKDLSKLIKEESVNPSEIYHLEKLRR